MENNRFIVALSELKLLWLYTFECERANSLLCRIGESTEKEIFYVEAKDCKLYCEKRGNGPLFVIVPPGSNDAGLNGKLAELLADEFTVVTFDSRGGSRSMPTVDRMVSAELFADDIAAIIKHMDMGKASIYGSCSGGQGTLMTAVKYPELVKNIIVHEAVLDTDNLIPNIGLQYLIIFPQKYGPYMTGRNVSPTNAAFFVNVCPASDYDDETNDRLEKNDAYWGKYYCCEELIHSYTDEELARIPACDITVGAWTTAWLPYTNIELAKRGGFSYIWAPAAHNPAISCPEFYADFCKKTTHKYD